MGHSVGREKHKLSRATVHVKMQSKNFRLLCLKVDLSISLQTFIRAGIILELNSI